MTEGYFTEEKKRRLIERLMDVKKDVVSLVKEKKLLEDIIRGLASEVEELKKLNERLYLDCNTCKDKERDALREQMEELRKNALKPGEVRAKYVCPFGKDHDLQDGYCKECEVPMELVVVKE